MGGLDKITLAAKRVVYGRRGEPYRIGGQTLRYLVGTRPIRLRYANSQNAINRYDALQVSWVWSHLREGDVAIDVGAHNGIYSILMAAKCGKTGHVVAFEPDPYAREILMRNIELNPNLKSPVVEASACADGPGFGTLFSRGGNSQSSLARSAVEFSAEDHAEEIQVPLIALDGYLAQHGLTVRCAKIDAEGAEIRILKGAPKLLAGPVAIICELHPYAWAEFGNDFAELKDVIASARRRMRYLDQQVPFTGDPQYGTVELEHF